MTYHIKADEYSCPKCGNTYIPFSKEMTCPKCSFCDPDTEKYHGFIGEVLTSMTINKIANGRYRPDAWYIGSMADAVCSTCFHFFDYLEQQKPKDYLAFLNEYTTRMEVDSEYGRKFIKEVLLEVYRQYKETKKPRLLSRGRIGTTIRRLRLWLSQFW